MDEARAQIANPRVSVQSHSLKLVYYFQTFERLMDSSTNPQNFFEFYRSSPIVHMIIGSFEWFKTHALQLFGNNHWTCTFTVEPDRQICFHYHTAYDLPAFHLLCLVHSRERFRQQKRRVDSRVLRKLRYDFAPVILQIVKVFVLYLSLRNQPFYSSDLLFKRGN